MNPGELRNQIIIQTPIPTSGGYGQETTWLDILTLRAKIETLNGKETFQGVKDTAELTHKITVRYNSTVKTKHRIKYCKRIFEIDAAINVDEKNKWLELYCKELVEDARF